MPAINTIPIEEAEVAVEDLSNFHFQTAKKIWPRGKTLVCPRCEREETALVGQLAEYLAGGWPTCCGETMWVQ